MIYLDHAATSHPKPDAVFEAMRHWFADLGVSAERGDSPLCLEVRRKVDALRERLGALCGTEPDRVAFVSGATEGLNLALRALCRPGDSVLTTAFEHSSVVRPLRALEKERDLRVEVLPPSADGGLDPATAASALQALRPRLFVFTHASNVTGARFDAEALCAAARQAGALSLLDASQTAGLHDLDLGADLVVASGHKSMFGPPAVGFLAARAGLEVPPQKQGGTGGSRALEDHPTEWPSAFEAGTPNSPGLLGWLAALEWIDEQGRPALLARCLELTAAFERTLTESDAVRVLSPPPGPRTAVTSFVHRDLDPLELGSILAAAGFHVRSGFHCSPWIHRHLGTERAGTVRVSPGPTLNEDDMRAAARAAAL